MKNYSERLRRTSSQNMTSSVYEGEAFLEAWPGARSGEPVRSPWCSRHCTGTAGTTLHRQSWHSTAQVQLAQHCTGTALHRHSWHSTAQPQLTQNCKAQLTQNRKAQQTQHCTDTADTALHRHSWHKCAVAVIQYKYYNFVLYPIN